MKKLNYITVGRVPNMISNIGKISETKNTLIGVQMRVFLDILVWME